MRSDYVGGFLQFAACADIPPSFVVSMGDIRANRKFPQLIVHAVGRWRFSDSLYSKCDMRLIWCGRHGSTVLWKHSTGFLYLTSPLIHLDATQATMPCWMQTC